MIIENKKFFELFNNFFFLILKYNFIFYLKKLL